MLFKQGRRKGSVARGVKWSKFAEKGRSYWVLSLELVMSEKFVYLLVL